MDLTNDVLLVSGPRSGAGGLFVIDGSQVDMIDALACQGMTYREGLLYRIVSCNKQAVPSSDLLVYDVDGLIATHRLDGMGQVHDAVFRGDDLLIVDTSGNRVQSLSPSGEVATWWQGTPRLDAWHINCLHAESSERVLATAFGVFYAPYGWTADLRATTGVVIELPSGNIIASGFSQPHNPRRFEDGLLVCNSLASEVLYLGPDGRLRQSIPLEGFTRGAAMDGRYLYIGESQPREQGFHLARSRVSVLDRETFEVVDRITIPVPEIYEILLVPRSSVPGLRAGFDGRDVRARGPLEPFARDRTSSWQISPRLPLDGMRARISASVPDVFEADRDVVVRCVIENLGDSRWCSAGPHPIELSYRWYDGRGSSRRDKVRVELPECIEAGSTSTVDLMVCTPGEPGLYGLTIALVQKGVGWFDEVHESSADSHFVVIITEPADVELELSL
jgi:hypothetical protein